jgi:DNA-binding transcriptional MerR regulator
MTGFEDTGRQLTTFDWSEPDNSIRYSIETAAYLGQVSRRTIVLYCKHGLISPVTDPVQSGWVFEEDAIRTIRRIERMREGFGMNLAGLKMLLSMTNELELLRTQVRFLRSRW